MQHRRSSVERSSGHDRVGATGRSLLLSAVSLVVFLVGAELAVRLLDPDLSLPGNRPRFRHDPQFKQETLSHVHDERLGWRLRPNQTSATIQTNAHGFRGPEFPLHKPPGVLRILFVGDSNVMGFGVADFDAIYSSVVGRCLAEDFPDRPAEIINLGVDAYSSHQVRNLLEEYAPQLTPDLVVIQVGFNDFLHSSRPDREQTYTMPAVLNVLERSQAYRWFRRLVLQAAGFGRRDFFPVPRVSPEEFESNLRQMIQICKNVAAIPVLVTTWARPYVPFAVNEVRVEEEGQKIWTTERRWIHAKLEQAGIDPPTNQQHPEYLRVIGELCAQRPHWSTPHFLRSQGLLAAGDLEEAERALRQAMQLESDRKVFEDYMLRLRRVGAAEAVHVFEMEKRLGPHLADKSQLERVALFIDFVHLKAEGHGMVGRALCSDLEAILRPLVHP